MYVFLYVLTYIKIFVFKHWPAIGLSGNTFANGNCYDKTSVGVSLFQINFTLDAAHFLCLFKPKLLVLNFKDNTPLNMSLLRLNE